jgi:XTP/dITP diphosphohydrolase
MLHLLVVATQNAHKLSELRTLLAGLPLHIVTPFDVLGHHIAVVEDGETFEANANKKALAIARATHAMTLADDSGLEVDGLGGAPGVRSARYAHEHATDAENNAALIARLAGLAASTVPGAPALQARFRCVLSLIDPLSAHGFEPHVVEGVCAGHITLEGRGPGGFGYDPLFVLADDTRTMAQLSETEKNERSHRGRACRSMRLLIERALAAREGQMLQLETRERSSQGP